MEIRRADYRTDYAALRAVRYEVFVDEQRVPPSEEMDDRDSECIHVLALEAGDPIGTGRIDLAADGKVGRVAVLAAWRRHGVGRAIMESLHEVARQASLESVWCHAQVVAVPFYEELGYRITSEPFIEADIEHVRMEMALR